MDALLWGAYQVGRFIFEISRDPQLLEQFQVDLDPLMEHYRLTEEEKRAIRDKEKVQPDVIIGILNEHFVNFYLNNMPAICMGTGEAPQEVKDVMRHYYMRYSGPGGLTEKDDMENWNYASAASKGVVARRYPYNYEMGLGLEGSHPDLPGIVTEGISEANQRGFYQYWAELMDGRRLAERSPTTRAVTGQQKNMRKGVV